MSLDARAEAALDAHLRFLRAFTLRGGGRVMDGDGVACFMSRHPLPFLVNAAARLDASVPPQRLLTVSRDFFVHRGFEVICLQGRDDDLFDAAKAEGFTSGEPDPLQYIDHAPAPSPADRASVELRPVTTPTAVADVAAVTTDAHQAYNGFPSDLFEVLFARPATVLSADMHAVVAYDNGGPVATAEVFMHDRLAYVGWVAVVRAATGRGLGWLVTEEVVTEALRRGAAAAVLMGSPMGAPLYRKMGFVDVGKLTNAYAPAVR